MFLIVVKKKFAGKEKVQCHIKEKNARLKPNLYVILLP